ncbi:MAG TPA: ABC-type transport auxiliary lipoprotein family protein [Croceibacterium sp.]|nr:ABC-type transport auxiliary lipoprotein family protein [Croceibacterium sp.]
MLKQALLPVLLALPLAGCVSLGGKTPEQLLTLTPARAAPAGAGTTAQAESALAVIEPDAEQRLNVTRVPVQVSESSVAYLQDAVWVEKPARLFQALVAETIRAKGSRLVVGGDLGYAAVTKLSGRLLDMGYDVASGSAVVRYDAVLQMPDGRVLTRRFESRVPGVAAEAAAVGPALNQAANQVADQVAEWVG